MFFFLILLYETSINTYIPNKKDILFILYYALPFSFPLCNQKI